MKFYRYQEDIRAAGGMTEWDDWVSYGYDLVDLKLLEFKSIKETAKGYWIVKVWNDEEPLGVEEYFGDGWHSFEKKWISKTSRKRYAYPSKEKALESFLIRKRAQVKYLKRDLTNAESALRLGENEQKILDRQLNHE